jgi:stress-induced-phosphoprotein 1
VPPFDSTVPITSIFSNRSAAYLKMGDAHNALEDTDAVIGLKPDFAKGYSRKGSALHALKRYKKLDQKSQRSIQEFLL